MIKLKNKFKVLDFLFIILILFLIALLVVLPKDAIASFLQGILLWGTKVLPALLPFFILTKLLSYTSFTRSIGKFLSPLTSKLYGVGGVSGYIYIMSILSGYPVGAKLTADFYESGSITSGQARAISAFTSTSGPLFVLGTVGIGLFASAKLGLIILISHYISALLNGLLYRAKPVSTPQIQSANVPQNVISESMSSSISSIMMVGGFIAIFYMILSLLLSINAFYLPNRLFGLMGVDESVTTAVISGIIEVTTGAMLLSKCSISFNALCLILSFLISFGGLSIHAQAFAFLKSFNMPYFKFFLQKLTHAIISTIVTLLILLVF